jgi:hypothetical protein
MYRQLEMLEMLKTRANSAEIVTFILCWPTQGIAAISLRQIQSLLASTAVLAGSIAQQLKFAVPHRRRL